MKSLTLAEKIWLMTNMQKDDMEELEKFKTLIRFIRPEAFSDDKNTEFTSDFVETIEEKLGRKLTDEELERIENGEQIEEYVPDLDLIERVEPITKE